MSTDNRTIINDCEATTGWTGDDAVTVVSDTGAFYEGSSSLSWQASDADEHMYTTQDSVGMGTFSLDWSDSTLYLLVKDNLGEAFSAGGVQYVIGDGTNRAGYDVGGNDAGGVLLSTYFQSYKLDVSVVVATPGNFTAYAGTEASLDQTTVTQVGYGCNHLAKAAGPSDNVFMDCFRYIANGSYALTINGGTSGTPETMADVQGDDVTNGWGMIGNPFGEQYLFFAPTEWGEATASADHYFTASNEQWYWLGDNGGGHAVGAGNFPFRVIGNATDTGSWVISNVVIVNLGTGADFDCSSANMDTLEIDACTFIGLASFSAPATPSTESRFCTNTQFLQCGQITHNGASMNGCTVSDSTVGIGIGAVFYDETADPGGEMDDMVFVKGSAAHHGIAFGTNSPTTINLNGVTSSGFNASNGQNDSFFHVQRTTGSVTINVSSGTGNFSYRTAGATVTVNTTVSITITVVDTTGAAISGARVAIYTDDASETEVMNTTTNGSGIATGSFGGTTPQAVFIRVRHASGSPAYLDVETAGTITATGLTATISMQEDTIIN